MSLYSEIKPFYLDNDKLLSLIKMYYNPKKIDLYDGVTKDPAEIDSEELEFYQIEFYNYIMLPSVEKIYKLMKLHGEEFDKWKLEQLKNQGMSEEEIEDYKNDGFKHIYPVKRFEKILKRFNSYYDACVYLGSYDSKIPEEFFKLDGQGLDIKTREKKVKEALHLSDEEYELLISIRNLKSTVNNQFRFQNDGVMGFHVNPNNLTISHTLNQERPDIKFYLNAGDDTYRFALHFKEECEKENINYYFKVADPYMDEATRSDKICIYSSYQNAEKIIKIIKKIEKEHPEIEFRDPPILCGTIDGFIGIGQDNIVNNDCSFNEALSEIITIVFNKIFANKGPEIVDYLEKNPNLLDYVRADIIKEAESKGFDPKTLCTRLVDSGILSRIQMPSASQSDSLDKEIESLQEKVRLNDQKIAVYNKKIAELEEQMKESMRILNELRSGKKVKQ